MSGTPGSETCALVRWRIVGATFLAIVLGFAVVGKLVSIYPFRDTVEVLLTSWFGGSIGSVPPMRDALVVAVIVCEVVLGTSFAVYCRSPRLPALAAAALLAAFSLVLLYMMNMPEPPSCGCLGGGSLVHADAHTNALFGVGRNAGLLVLAIWLALAEPSKAQRITRSSGFRPGFTLIEIIVVIVVIAIIIAVSLPILGSAKRQAKAVSSLSTLRQCLAGLTQYSEAERGYLPFLAIPGDPEKGVLSDRPWPDSAPVYFRGQTKFWPTALLAHGIDLSVLPEVSRLPMYENDLDDPSVLRAWVWLTHAAHARSEYWIGHYPPASDSFYTGVRLEEALYPSKKGLIGDVGLLAERWADHWNVGMVDGSASVRSRVDPPVMMSDLPRPYGAVAWRVLTTYKGMHGIDY